MPGSSASGTRVLRTDLFGFWLIVHILCWTAYATVSFYPGSIHHDMAEAFVWGQQWQFGYYKHPPFWAFVAALWFKVWPQTDWSFYLLAMTNSALGMWGGWLVAGRYLSGERRLAAVLLLQFLPVFHFLAFKFNANSIFLSIWPFAIYFYLRLVEERRLVFAVALGVVCAVGLLSKYFFGVLLIAFVVLTLIDRERRALLATPLPWIAGFICLLGFSPHVVWMLQNGSPTLNYVSTIVRHDAMLSLRQIAVFMFAFLAFHSIAFLVFAAIINQPVATLMRAVDWWASSKERKHLFLLTVLPPLIAALIALVSGVRIDSNYAIGTIPLTTCVWLMTPGLELRPSAMRWLKKAAAGLMVGGLLLSPVISGAFFSLRIGDAEKPRKEIALLVNDLWSAHVGRPLTLVSGSWRYAYTLAFYLPGNVAEFTDLSTKKAPWVTLERVAREGIVVVCEQDDSMCFNRAKAVLGTPVFSVPVGLSLQHFGMQGPVQHLMVLIYPPSDLI